MMNFNPKQHIEKLRTEINRHNKEYYVNNAPTVSDYDFDLMMQELIRLEALYPQYNSPDSPTNKVGSDLEGPSSPFKQYPHKHPMLSLANTYNIEELKEFDAKARKLSEGDLTYNCELKFDGTGINLLYKNGILIRALTRGDGIVGDDVTRNIKTIKGIPQKLIEGSGYPDEFEIRGEVYMPFEAFDKLNIERELNEDQLFANPRNAAAGSLKILNPKVAAKRGLQCVLYHLITEKMPTAEHSKALAMAATWGLPISEYSKECKNIDEVIEYITSWDTERRKLPFPTDGMVVKVNEFARQASLGFTAKTPRWAVAYKFKAEQALTKVLSIDYQVGRTGAITPVANLEPVQLSGTVVKRASLYNADSIRQLDIRISDYVYVKKGGEIIPQITGVELSKRGADTPVAAFPETCPICGAQLVRHEDEVKRYCPNSDNCLPQIEGKFIHFCSRKALDINLGEASIHKLCERGYLKRFEDLYMITSEQLMSIDKWKEKSVKKYRASTERSKSAPFAKVLYGLSISGIGATIAKTLSSKFKNIDSLINAPDEELTATPDVGETSAKAIGAYFKNADNLRTIRKLREIGLQFETRENGTLSEELNGMTIVITGNYSISREEMKQYIEAHGGKVTSYVSSSSTYILAGAKPGESKMQKAEELKIPVIGEEDLYKMAGKTLAAKPEPKAKPHPEEEPNLFSNI